MRINRGSLLRVIRNTISTRTRSDRNLISIYLAGSVVGEDYALGGTVDIDLFFIHSDLIEIEREIVRITDEVHLDIAHHDQRDYNYPKDLRLDPWMGPTINRAEIFFDPGHFMDFTQASVRGQFDHPDNVLARVRAQAEKARNIWFTYEMEHPEAGPGEVADYLEALWNAGNAIASLSGPPMTERRYLLQFQQRTEAMGRSGLYAGFLGLLGAPNLEMEQIHEWLPAWDRCYTALDAEQTPARLHPVRRLYYLRGFEEILAGEQPGATLWPLLNTWTLMAKSAPENSTIQDSWHDVFETAGLLGEGFGEKIEALDAFLDQTEESVDNWARRQGIL